VIAEEKIKVSRFCWANILVEGIQLPYSKINKIESVITLIILFVLLSFFRFNFFDLDQIAKKQIGPFSFELISKLFFFSSLLIGSIAFLLISKLSSF